VKLYEAAGGKKPEGEASYTTNIEGVTESNTNFRKVLHTTKLSQLVVMSLKPNEDIGMETHESGDQFIRVESGEGKVILNGKEEDFNTGDAVVIAAGTKHNIINMSDSKPLQIYAIYTPPEHKDGTIDKDKPE